MKESDNSSTTESTNSKPTSSTLKIESYLNGSKVTRNDKVLFAILVIWVAAILSPYTGTCCGAFFASWLIVEYL
jgi:Na+-transporting methylmalonyl-CoA/oxaloacetate decarboxylase beta subunit